MKFGDKVFVVTATNVLNATIRHTMTLRGFVTGYQVTFTDGDIPVPQQTKIEKKYVFTDEDAARKALFVRTLKVQEQVRVPSEDKIDDRYWVQGYGSRRRPR